MGGTAGGASLRVLHIGKYFPPHAGGMETYLRDLMVVQHRKGLEVNALVHTSKANAFDEEIEVDALDGSSFKVRLAARWFNLGFIPVSPLFWLSAMKLIRQFNPDIIHVHHPNSSAIWLLLIKAARTVPWVAQWHSDILSPSSSWVMKFFYALYRPVEQHILNRSAVILATSQSYLEDSEALANHTYKTKVVPLGLDTLRLPDPKELQSTVKPKNFPLVLFLGRLASYKGLPYLLKAIAQLPYVYCLIAGSGNEKAALEKEVTRLKIESRVRFAGSTSEQEKWRYLKTADVVVLPSTDKNEAFGIVILEAGYLSKPMVVTDILGSGAGWVASHFGAKIVTAGDHEALAKGIRDVLASPTQNAQSHQANTCAQFNLETQVEEVITHYQSIVR